MQSIWAALIKYLHATAGSPKKQMWLKAIKAGNFWLWPGLTSTNAAPYYPEDAKATIMGHITQAQQGLQSTQTDPMDAACNAAYMDACGATCSTQAEFDTRYAAAFEPQLCNKVHFFNVALETFYTDDCGKFLVRSFSRNQYIKCA
jgi:hypothetical protein